jgi:hypothetical protein
MCTFQNLDQQRLVFEAAAGTAFTSQLKSWPMLSKWLYFLAASPYRANLVRISRKFGAKHHIHGIAKIIKIV